MIENLRVTMIIPVDYIAKYLRINEFSIMSSQRKLSNLHLRGAFFRGIGDVRVWRPLTSESNLAKMVEILPF